MLRSWLSPCLLFIFFSLWTTGPLPALSLELGATGTVQVGAGQGFGPKLQPGASGSVGMSIPLARWLDLDLSLELIGVTSSDMLGGFSYRGYYGGALALGLQGYASVASGKSWGELLLGGGLGAAAALPAYGYTTLYFFYPEARLEGFLDWRPATQAGYDFRLSIPVRAQFRRDMSYSVSTGIGISVRYRLPRAK